MNKEKTKQLYQRNKPYLKYIIVVVIFGGLILFGGYSYIKRVFEIDREIRDLKEQIAIYEQEIEKSNTEIKQLIHSREDLERLAREKYGMQEENEDVFIFEK